MALTAAEFRQLRELADELARDNPRLARALTGRRYARPVPATTSERPRRNRVFGLGCDWLAAVLTVAGIATLVSGAIVGLSVLIAVGAVALADGPALFAARRIWQTLRP